MIKNINIEIKIIISIILFTTVILGFERYYMSDVVIKQFKESKKIKNNILINTILPLVSLNLSFGLHDSTNEYLDLIAKQNSDVEYLELRDNNANLLYMHNKEDESSLSFVHSESDIVSRNIVDTVTKKQLGTIEIHFYDDDYRHIIKSNNKVTLTILFVTLVLLSIFILYIKQEFKLLKELSDKVLAYNPNKNNLTIEKLDREDEVGIINNAIFTMVEKIKDYAYKLDKANISLEKKVIRKSDQIAEQEEMILAQSKLATMGEMMSMIAHQWRQPLSTTTLLITNEKLKNMLAGKEESEYDKILDKISSTLMYLSETIDDFQTYFKPGKAKEEISVNSIIERVKGFIGARLTMSKVELNVDIEDDILVKTYANELVQVIMNILNNATDALIEAREQERKIWIKMQVDKNINISIEDNAGGIDSSILHKVFEPYFSTKSKNGTGLGLYMAKMIIENHMSGELSVSNSQNGALFKITLPLNSKS
ncbi:GHKL domain-containing protein [Sulfurimonas aquatica]|uniref:histidine kinase n=1 Tax=Sulfurimonas aquatica TaxID=2672570 RepID=A0A975GDH1_9BACT|nr:HAMP domain-containing sensor histidine kinase [Sulfurimonas aquatica]QSZ42309.1 GHKL domain-containing protein [Sulfurimonas aquatica]